MEVKEKSEAGDTCAEQKLLTNKVKKKSKMRYGWYNSDQIYKHRLVNISVPDKDWPETGPVNRNGATYSLHLKVIIFAYMYKELSERLSSRILGTLKIFISTLPCLWRNKYRIAMLRFIQ